MKKIKRSDHITVKEIDGEGILFDPENGSLHILNNTGLFIWRLCDGQRTLSSLAKEVAVEYQVQANCVEDDIKEIVEQLKERQLLKEV